MNIYFENFYQGWNEKLGFIQGDGISQIFDRFITAFVIYNFLYNQIPIWQIQHGHPVPQKVTDRKAASDYVVNFLGAENLLQRFENAGNAVDIHSVIQLIQNEVYYINLNYGDRQRNEDLRLLEELISNSSQKKSVAILKVIYYVRCNLFHGHKDFHEHQGDLLRPLINLLKTVNQFLFERLM